MRYRKSDGVGAFIAFGLIALAVNIALFVGACLIVKAIFF